MPSIGSIQSHPVPVEQRSMVERRFPRFAVELPCLYSIGHNQDWNGTAVNLSRGGCAIRGVTPVQKSHFLEVRIFMAANQPPIEVLFAPVRWTTGEQFGVEFITLVPRDVERLQTYLSSIEGEVGRL